MTGKDQTSNDQQAQQANQSNQVQQPQPKQQANQEPIDTPAPRYHASDSVTWFQQRQRQQEKDYAQNKTDPGIPDSARPVALENASYVPLPAGGIAALADKLYPSDKDNPEAMHQHVFDLMVANRDVVRTDTDAPVGTPVRIP